MEIRQIPGHTLYGATRCGRIFSKATMGSCRRTANEWRERKCSPCSGGKYLQFNVLNGGKVMVHRAVAETFIGPVPMGYHVAHLNGNPRDNRVENLSIVTAKENNSHKLIHGTHINGSKMWSSKLNEGRVIAIRNILKKKVIPAWKLAKLYGVSESTISQVKSSKKWRHT